MITDEIKKIDERLHLDNEDLGAVYANFDWIGVTLGICKNRGFNEEDTTEITREIGYLLLGIAPAEEFAQQIKSRTHLTEASLRLLLEDISREILAPLEEGMMILEETAGTLIKQIEDERKNEENGEPAKHILVVPIKGKDEKLSTIGVQKPLTVPTKKKVDPYREPIN